MLKFSEKFRPKNLDDFIGQTSVIGKNSFLKRAIESKNIPHIFLYGPPGTGKTTLSYIIAENLGYDFFNLNATTLGIKEIRDIIAPYKNYKKKPLIFIDEIHRLNKKQQEVLLPIMEFNKAIIIGASTENLYYSLTDAIRSRAILLKFNFLGKKELNILLDRVIKELEIEIDSDSKEYLLIANFGDARGLLIHLELAYNVSKIITLDLLKSIKENNNIKVNKDSTSNLMSAFIKSIRGSDPDAALYYLIMLIEKGEKADYIARRLVILASEDIGNANPNALTLAVSTMTATKQIGYPESKLILTQCTIYLASSPKSNSVIEAINNTYNEINRGKILEVPEYLKCNTKGYKNPHNYKHYLKQNYLATPLKLVKLKGIAFESRLLEWLDKIKKS